MGLAYGVNFYVFLGLVMLFEPRMRGSHWCDWGFLSFGLGSFAMALVLTGLSLLAWALVQHSPSGSKGKSSAQICRRSGVWDWELDG
jgi:hypothetical protein